MGYSYSRLSMYDGCPRKYRHKYIDKLPTPPSSGAASRGSEIHKTIEDFLGGKREDLHAEVHQHYGQFMFSIRGTYKGHMHPEEQWAVNDKWEFVDFEDPTYMLRGITDLRIHTPSQHVVYDWKTGKIYDSHEEQGLLYGLIALLQEPEPAQVTVHRVYLDKKQNRTITYAASMISAYKMIFLKHMDKINRDEDFIPTPSFSCRWCPFSRYKGGPCEF